LRPTETHGDRIQAGSPELRRISLAMFLCGFAIFSMLYGVQPLLPEFARDFSLSTAHAGWVLSISMVTLALLLIPLGIISDRIGRKSIIVVALGIAALLTLATALAPTFTAVLILRGLTGCALAGVPAIALAYLSEEVAPNIIGRTIGLYAAGNTLGAVAGRLLASALGDWSSWRAALTVIGALGIFACLVLQRTLPTPRNFQPLTAAFGKSLQPLVDHCRNPELLRYFAMAALLLGTFISLFTYLTFRLAEPPFNVSPATASLIFLFYLLGLPASIFAGRFVDRNGPYKLFGAGVMLMIVGLLSLLSNAIAAMVVALAITSIGYFLCYAAANSSVTRRAPYAKASAAALYLCAFYGGGGFINAATGWLWAYAQWRGVIFFLLALMLLFAALWLSMPTRETKARTL
jgi:MFS transporter, YNFM family, putative membrane transport protein